MSESNESNNVTTDTYTVTESQEPDLVVSSLTHSPTNPTTADTITFVATVQNIGSAPAAASVLRFRIGGESSPPTYPIPTLAPSATYSVTRTAQLTAQNYVNEATADFTGVVSESNESNNVTTDTYTVTAASPLSNGVTVLGTINGQSSQESWVYYYADLPLGAFDLLVSVTDLTVDVDLYTRFEDIPDLNSFDCRPFISGMSDEECHSLTPAAGRWWIGVNNWGTGPGTFTIGAYWTVSAEPLFIDGFETGDVLGWSSAVGD